MRAFLINAMKTLLNLSDVFKKYAAVLSVRARMGQEWSILISDNDKQQSIPESFTSYAAANDKVTALNKQGINASVVWTDPYARNLETGYRLYIKPRNGFGSFTQP